MNHLFRLLHFPQRPLYMYLKELACLRQNNLSPETVEEARAELFFKAADLNRERRLGNMHMLRGAAEILVRRNGHEIFQLAQFHN
ncbi:MAG: hypothetical protein LZF60_160089 [Nitrospira sp.]|nr:MAG: hypothetical protein LZF60_160089 [Nitrospira sp.]